jgi:hypothetical protein
MFYHELRKNEHVQTPMRAAMHLDDALFSKLPFHDYKQCGV